MSTQLLGLKAIQQIDHDVDEGKLRFTEINKLLKETTELVTAEKRLVTAHATARQWHKQQQDLELEIGTLNSKHSKAQEKLYSGKVANPKELIDIQKEVDSLQRHINMLEERLLETMTAFETAQTEEQTAQQQYSHLDDASKQAQTRLTSEKQTIATRISYLLEQRKTEQRRISADILQQYDQVRRTKRYPWITTVNMQSCATCQTTLPNVVTKRVVQGDIVICSSCGRLLISA